MTNIEDRPPPAVGAYWINEGDYPALLNIFADSNRMPRTWKEWLKIAEEMGGLKAYGHVVMRVSSIRIHFRTGAPLTAQAPAVKDASYLLQPLPRGRQSKLTKRILWARAILGSGRLCRIADAAPVRCPKVADIVQMPGMFGKCQDYAVQRSKPTRRAIERHCLFSPG